MVRHHVKKKKGDSHHNKKQEEQKQLEEELENLDRFAGSSDEDDEEDGDDSEVEDVVDGDEDDGLPAVDMQDDDDDDDDEEEVKQTKSNKSKARETSKDSQTPKGKNNEKTKVTKSKVANKEEDSSSDDDDNDYKNYNNKDKDDNDQDDEESSSDDDDDEILSPGTSRSNGMSNAMSRILGLGSTHAEPSAASTAAPIILSKTTTPLQRLQQKIKTEEQATRIKRQNRRVDNLSAMRLPLAPSAGMSAEKLWKQTKKNTKNKKESKEEEEGNAMNSNAIAIANEIDAERSHRRIATRGVVALFNAISKHRQAVVAEAAAKEAEKLRKREEEGRALKKKKIDGDGVSKTTKFGFLDMIKKSAGAGGGTSQGRGVGGGDGGDAGVASSDANESKEDKGGKSNSGGAAVGWSALKDDFMMNSKLKVRGLVLIF